MNAHCCCCELMTSHVAIDKKRVLFPFVGDTFGGSHVSALELIRRLPESGFQPIVGVHETGPLTRILDEEKIEWIELPAIRYPKSERMHVQVYSMIRNAGRLARLVKTLNIEIVHTNDRRMHLTWLLPSRFAGAAHVWHERTNLRSKRIAFYSILSTKVIAISEYIRSGLPGSMASRAQVVVNPVECQIEASDAQRVRRAVNDMVSMDDGCKQIIWIGRWNEQKRPMIVVEIAHHVVELFGPEVCFVMLGAASQREQDQFRQRAAELNVEANFVFREFERPVEPWIAAADILLATAVREGLGRTVIEAMQLGTPVVVSDDGGHREIVENGVSGIRVEPCSARAFAEAIVELFRDENKKTSYVIRARDTARLRFSTATHCREISEVYKGIRN